MQVKINSNFILTSSPSLKYCKVHYKFLMQSKTIANKSFLCVYRNTKCMYTFSALNHSNVLFQIQNITLKPGSLFSSNLSFFQYCFDYSGVLAFPHEKFRDILVTSRRKAKWHFSKDSIKLQTSLRVIFTIQSLPFHVHFLLTQAFWNFLYVFQSSV